jgi:DNA-binding transcriptional regulator YiaG
MSTANLIIRAGEALWGERWQAEMARALEVHKDTVQDWRQGRAQPRPGIYLDLLRIAVERQAELDELVEALRCKA